MPTFYRVEKSNGDGPYVGTGDFHAHADGQCCWVRHPAPMDDRIWDYKGLSFGFKSKRQLRAWFCKADREHLAKFGYTVGRYYLKRGLLKRGDHFKSGERQVCFLKRKSTFLGRVPIDQWK